MNAPREPIEMPTMRLNANPVAVGTLGLPRFLLMNHFCRGHYREAKNAVRRPPNQLPRLYSPNPKPKEAS